MAQIEIYTTPFCPYCSAAKALLEQKGATFTEIDVLAADKRQAMTERAHGRRTVPQIFIGATHVGGYDDLAALDRQGRLDPLLAGRLMRVAALQMRSGLEPAANIAALDLAVAEAVGQGARYVLSPEVTIAMTEGPEGLRRVAEKWDGNSAVAQVAEIARRHGVLLHLGSLAVALPDGRFANRSVLFGPDGAIHATYDKIHLFDANLPGLAAYRESATYAPGDTAVVSEAGGMMLGLSVCYDLRFGALYRALAEGGAQVLAVPAAFTAPTGAAHWETLLRARAIETGCYVIAAAQGGLHENGRTTWGHSMVVDPWGTIVAQLEHDAPGVLVAELDLSAVGTAREKVPALDNARPFSLCVNHTGPHFADRKDSAA